MLVASTGYKVFIICEIQTFQLFQIRDIPIIDSQTHNRTDTWLPKSFYNWIKHTRTQPDQNRRHSKTQMLHKPNLITKFFVRFRFVSYRFSFSFAWKRTNIHIHYTQTRIAETLSGNDWVAYPLLSLHSSLIFGLFNFYFTPNPISVIISEKHAYEPCTIHLVFYWIA